MAADAMAAMDPFDTLHGGLFTVPPPMDPREEEEEERGRWADGGGGGAPPTLCVRVPPLVGFPFPVPFSNTLVVMGATIVL